MDETAWVCATCGVENVVAAEPPADCAICVDERQYVPRTGQSWTTLEQLATPADRPGGAGEPRRIRLREREPGLFGLVVEPSAGIGQEALLAVTEQGNLLWDVPPYIDDDAVAQVRALGGVAAIMASHPHMYGVQSSWSEAFDGAPVWIAERDREFLLRRPGSVRFWTEPFEVLPGVLATQPGGHFPGSTVVRWPGRDGRGVLLTGDTIFPTPHGHWVTFMRSYPNQIPLSGPVVERIAAAVAELSFDRLYGNFGGVVPGDANAVVARSAVRYVEWVSGKYDDLT